MRTDGYRPYLRHPNSPRWQPALLCYDVDMPIYPSADDAVAAIIERGAPGYEHAVFYVTLEVDDDGRCYFASEHDPVAYATRMEA